MSDGHSAGDGDGERGTGGADDRARGGDADPWRKPEPGGRPEPGRPEGVPEPERTLVDTDVAAAPGAPAIEPYALTSDEHGGVKARRFWSSRRVPAAITAAVVLGVSGLFLYDVASVRAGREAMAWRKRLAHELATRPLDNGWVIGGAALAAVLGVWLIVLAVTPGERGVLPMARRSPASVRAGLDRHAAELVLRDRAMEVSGIRWARVTVGRRRIGVRASSHFRELDEVRRDLTAALGEAVRQLGLARQPQLSVHLQRAEKKG